MAGLPIITRTCPHCGNSQYNPFLLCEEELDGGRILVKRCTWWDCKKIIAVVGSAYGGQAPAERLDTLTELERMYLHFFRWVLAVDRRRWKDRESAERPYPLMLRPKE